ncbi:MAG: bifunctional 4-hydroxy-2-oxoglutarate aldolase/2-dehydro-3-deoxy-phosphogluconate aldolase [Acidimicrobiales bacterium]
MLDVRATIGLLRVLPVVVIEDSRDALPVARALRDGGLPCAEITLRTSEAITAIRAIREQQDIVLGAGTVTRADQAAEAVAAGARFIVSPGFSSGVVRACQELGVPVFPGISTPTEMQLAMDAGLDIVKFFPAESFGGLRTLKAMSAVYPDMRFIPTGGINEERAAAYLAEQEVFAVGGTWIASRDLIGSRDFQGIEARAERARDLVARTRNF